MKLKPYPKYKDSGVQWIGKIPAEWKVRKLKYSYEIIGKTDIPASEGNENGKYPFFTSGEVIKFVDKSVTNGEYVIVGDGGISNFKYYEGEFSYSDHCFLLKTNKQISTRFLYYFLIGNGETLDILCFHGIGLRNLDKYKFNSFLACFPPFSDQTFITNFLDSKTAKIDALIEKDKRLIGLLKEKRAALINHAVTKGLYPNAKMKDSGIDWIGEIPEGWEVRKLKFNALVNPPGKKALSNPKTLVNFLPMEKVSENGKYEPESKAEYQDVSTGYTYFEDNDVLVAKITPCFENGKGTLANDLKFGFGFGTTEFHVIRSYDNLNPKYLFYLTKTHLFRVTGEAFMEGAAGQKRVPTNFVKDFIMVTPPRSEQTAIANFLDKATSKIDKTIKLIEKKIELLEEYKKSLIHHTVTGKIDVRGLEY